MKGAPFITGSIWTEYLFSTPLDTGVEPSPIKQCSKQGRPLPLPPPPPPTPHQDHELAVRRLIKIITGNSHTFLTEPIASAWAAFVQFPEFFHAFVVAIARTRQYNTNAYRMIHRAFTRQGPECCHKIQSKPSWQLFTLHRGRTREICWANQSPSKVGLPMDQRKISFIIIIIIIIIIIHGLPVLLLKVKLTIRC